MSTRYVCLVHHVVERRWSCRLQFHEKRKGRKVRRARTSGCDPCLGSGEKGVGAALREIAARPVNALRSIVKQSGCDDVVEGGPSHRATVVCGKVRCHWRRVYAGRSASLRCGKHAQTQIKRGIVQVASRDLVARTSAARQGSNLCKLTMRCDIGV